MTVIEEVTHVGVKAVFRALPHATTPKVLFQLDRRDRIVFMLLDGRRTLHDVAGLIHRREVDVARSSGYCKVGISSSWTISILFFTREK